ncbi:unnamed protein product [Periconia digitata]|uniref:Uncharacterized protein n=1 Tax=Periconia digitata TaxID=1303443 RepID=A0A9W4UR89_9PLEO|nr:unnamed protein product [Periconia digitata]
MVRTKSTVTHIPIYPLILTTASRNTHKNKNKNKHDQSYPPEKRKEFKQNFLTNCLRARVPPCLRSYEFR